MKRFFNKKVLLAIKIVITVLFVIMVNRTVSFKALFSNPTLTLQAFAIVVLISIGSQLLMVLRWHYSLRYFGASVSLKDSTTSYFAGSVLAALTPGRAGELLRGLTLKDVSKMESSFIVIFERFVSIAILFSTGAICSYFLPSNYMEATTESGLIVPKLGFVIPTIRILGAVAFVALITIPYVLGHKVRRFKGRGENALVVVVLSLFVHAFLLIQTAFLLQNCGVVTYAQGVVVSAESYSAMQLIPITIGNMGIRESYFQLFSLSFTDLNMEELKLAALTASLTIMFSNLILPAFPGLFVFLTYHLNNKDVRKIGNN